MSAITNVAPQLQPGMVPSTFKQPSNKDMYMLSAQSSANKYKDTMVAMLFLITVTGVATCIGLTFRPTTALTKDQTLPADDPNVKHCKACALDPVKLYSYSFGWSIAAGLLLLVIGWTYVNYDMKKHLKVMGTARAAFGGTDTLTGTYAQNMYQVDQLAGPSYNQINQGTIGAQTAIGQYHDNSQQQMLKNMNMYAGGRWIATSRP